MSMKIAFSQCFTLKSLQKTMKIVHKVSIKVSFNLCDFTYCHEKILAVYGNIHR